MLNMCSDVCLLCVGPGGTGSSVVPEPPAGQFPARSWLGRAPSHGATGTLAGQGACTSQGASLPSLARAMAEDDNELKRRYMRWSGELQEAYLEALEECGGLNEARPKALLDLLLPRFPFLTLQASPGTALVAGAGAGGGGRRRAV